MRFIAGGLDFYGTYLITVCIPGELRWNCLEQTCSFPCRVYFVKVIVVEFQYFSFDSIYKDPALRKMLIILQVEGIPYLINAVPADWQRPQLEF